MKQFAVTILCLFAALISHAHPSSLSPANGIKWEDASLEVLQGVENQTGSILAWPEEAITGAFGTCKFKIDMEIGGVHVKGTLTIEDVNFLECAAMKIGKFFSDLF